MFAAVSGLIPARSGESTIRPPVRPADRCGFGGRKRTTPGLSATRVRDPEGQQQVAQVPFCGLLTVKLTIHKLCGKSLSRAAQKVDVMATLFEHVHVPRRLRGVLGHPEPGSRVHRRAGYRDDFAAWFEAVCEVCGADGAVSPGAVALYAKVSRAGVHKRLKEGRLTAFLFRVVEVADRAGSAELPADGGRAYTFIPLRECRAWADSLRSRGRRARRAERPAAAPDRAAGIDDSWKQW